MDTPNGYTDAPQKEAVMSAEEQARITSAVEAIKRYEKYGAIGPRHAEALIDLLTK